MILVAAQGVCYGFWSQVGVLMWAFVGFVSGIWVGFDVGCWGVLVPGWVGFDFVFVFFFVFG